MYVLVELLLVLSALALAHTYVFYPLMVWVMAKGKPANSTVFTAEDNDLPRVTVLMSLYNEEQVIARKMESLLALNYPEGKCRFLIGSDCSDDKTNDIVSKFSEADERVHFFPFVERRGKPPVINELAKRAEADWGVGADHVFVVTDASVLLAPETLFELVKHFKNQEIGVVDAFMHNVGLQEEGISKSEHQYLNAETRVKNAEGRLWGKMIGPFGGCYALRSDLFEPVPPNSLVDDFFLAFRALEKGFRAINDLNAHCYEGATHRVEDEYRRKRRIAAGSFQNLARFKKWILPPVTTLGFAFFSHKVLRWFGGFFLILIWACLGILAFKNQMYYWLFCLYSIAILGIPLLNVLLQRIGISFFPLKSLHYFLAMNLALVAGFFKWARGIKTNTWQRTTRYEQSN